MSLTRPIFALPGRSSVLRWTLFGTLACVLASVGFSFLALGDLGPDVVGRILVSAMVPPMLFGAPLFFFFSVKVRQLKRDNVRLDRVARTDSLTSCLNRGAFTARTDAWLRDEAHSPSGALIMIDADNFKAINDLYGHDMGDEALTIIARAIRAVLRNGDIVGRMGGEEFAVFLPGVNQYQAEQVAERIRRSVNAANFTPEGRRHDLSVSLGGAVFDSRTSFAELFRIADQRLYGAKYAGRNFASVAQVDDHPNIHLKRSA